MVEKKKIAGLVVALVVVLVGGVVFMGAVSGWFSGAKVTLSEEYYCEGEECYGGLMDLTVEEYGKLIEEKKSFVILIDKGGCITAEKMKEFIGDFTKEYGVKFYRMDYGDMKETNMKEKVKYYPSVVIVSEGEVVAFLRADSEEDAGAYNEYGEFEGWLWKTLKNNRGRGV